MDIIAAKCPACKTISEHTYNGIQEGLPVLSRTGNLVKDSNGYVLKNGELWTCKNCKSTWFKEIG